MKKIIFAFILISHCLFSSGPTQSYLKELPFAEMVELYQKEAEKDPTLQSFPAFFLSQKALFQSIIEEEEAARDSYVFYRGASGQRLVFDTIRALYEAEHQVKVPQDFVFFRDPADASIPMTELWKTLMKHWPLLELEEKKELLEAILNRPLQEEQVELIWNVLWGDLDVKRDLTDAQKQSITETLGERLKEYRRYFHALKAEKWEEERYSVEERKEIENIYARLEERGLPLLEWMRDLDYNVDYLPDLRPRMIAVNLGLFSGCVNNSASSGLYASKDECTPLYWFAPNLGYHRKVKNEALRREMLEPILRQRGIPLSEIDELEALYRALQPEDDQLLFQIFVPRRLVWNEQQKEEPLIDSIFYLSHKVGRPAYYLGPVRPSELLEDYRNDVSQIPGFLQLQGRLVFTQEGLLNPYSGIRMRTYYLPGASQERLTQYSQALKDWVKRVALKPLNAPLTPDCPLISLKAYFKVVDAYLRDEAKLESLASHGK